MPDDKTIYLIRHAAATGQVPDAPLTSEGIAQADALAEFLSNVDVRQIVSSPFARAVNTIKPFSIRSNIEIKLDERLIEAALSTTGHPDWLDKLRDTFSDHTLSFVGGESSHAAATRAMAAINEALLSDTGPTAVVTHGRLLTLILKHFDPKYGFDEWQSFTTPDVFRIVIKADEHQVDRVWQ
jgi:2,3-bisphosphoglycerate-dependent phosphoglycerate mutase